MSIQKRAITRKNDKNGAVRKEYKNPLHGSSIFFYVKLHIQLHIAFFNPAFLTHKF